MKAAKNGAGEFARRLEAFHGQQAEIWAAFGRDFDTKADLVSYLVDLAFCITSDQAAQMEQQGGLPTASLTVTQWGLLARTEPLAEELGFLDPRRGEETARKFPPVRRDWAGELRLE